MKPILILSAFTFSAVAIYALASEDSMSPHGRAAWLSQQEIASRLEQQGYRVHRLEAEHSCVEAYVSDPGGRKSELYVDPTTGMPGCRGKYRDDD